MTSTEPRARLPRSATTESDLPGNLLDTPPALPVSPGRSGVRRRRTALAIGLCAVLPVGALAAGVGIALDRDAAAQAAWRSSHDAATTLAASSSVDRDFFDGRRLATMTSTGDELRSRTLAEAQAAADQARALAIAAEHAGPDTLAALQAAADTLEDLAGRLGSGASPAAVRDGQAATAEAGAAVQQAEDAWQAEQSRIQAEAAAQAERARQGNGSGTRTTTSTAGAGTSTTAPGSTWAPGVQTYGIAGLGAVLNQRRAEAGLTVLSVVGSSSLADHAAEMAAAGSIWHSGRDHIVGWVDPANDGYMIQAYLDSPPHRAWILKEGVTQVSIGAVTINGVLYTAMVFS